jgi:predicted CoA-substrate-specific enzyme activase
VAGEIIGADIVRNEITAQARGARFFVPGVQSVFEIGGQDSKYICLKEGMVVDNEMNKACAASTGSFLEEQARILGIKIEEQFADAALGSRTPCSLSEKCAILMASSLAHYHASPVGDKCAGLARSVCYNYLNRVVGNRKLGGPIVFQGAVAFNRAIVAGFETILDQPIYVPPYPHLTGAIGIANIARDDYQHKLVSEKASLEVVAR